MSVRVSRVSKLAALLIVVVGIFTLVVGLATGLSADLVAGTTFILLGAILYRLLYRFAKKVEREISEGGRAS